MLMTQMAQASFLDSCEFDMKVNEVGAIQTQKAAQPNYSRQVKATVLSVTNKGGHTDCSFHVDKEYDMNLVSAALVNLALLQPGYRISVDYFHVNGLTPSTAKLKKLTAWHWLIRMFLIRSKNSWRLWLREMNPLFFFPAKLKGFRKVFVDLSAAAQST